MSCQITQSPQVLPSPQPAQNPQPSQCLKYARGLAAGAVVVGGIAASAMAINSLMRTEMPIAPLATELKAAIFGGLGGLCGSLTSAGVAAYLIYEERRFNHPLNFKVEALARNAILAFPIGVVCGLIMFGITYIFPSPAEQK